MAIYRKSKQARRSPPHHRARGAKGYGASISSAGLWLLIGLFIGILGAATVYQFLTGKWSIANVAHADLKNPTEKTTKNPTLQKSKTLTQKKEPAQRFEFYQILPGMEVPIPDIDNPDKIPSTLVTKPKTIPPTKPLAKTETKLAAPQYRIQAGAYRTLGLAETLKSRLASQGFTAHIQKIDAEDGIWFRVMLGPYPSEAMALNQKNQLTKQNIRGILILQRQ